MIRFWGVFLCGASVFSMEVEGWVHIYLWEVKGGKLWQRPLNCSRILVFSLFHSVRTLPV